MLQARLLRKRLFFNRSLRCVMAFVLGIFFLTLQSILFAQVSMSPAAHRRAASNLALIPMPREIHVGKILSLDRGVSVSTIGRAPEDQVAARDLADTLRQRGVDAREGGKSKVKIVLMREDAKRATGILVRAHLTFDPAMHDEGYALVTEGNTTYDIAATSADLSAMDKGSAPRES